MAEGTAPLVGRRVELEVLEQALAALDKGTPGIVQIAGEQGIGKTRLVGEVCSQAERRRHLVFTGRAIEFEQERVFGTLVDALDDYLESLDRRDLEKLTQDSASKLSTVFPALAGLAASPPRITDAERYRIHRGVIALLDSLSVQRPLVLALDDFHWADAGSIEFVSSLLRRPPKGRVLLLLAFRPAQLSERFQADLDAAVREHAVARVDLKPLTEDEARQLLGPGFDRAATNELYRLSGGNPFYLEELARAGRSAVASGAGSTPLSVPAPVPPAVQGVLAAELAALSPQAQGFLKAAAAAGDPFEEGLAAAIADMPEGGELPVLDELLEADLIRPTTVPRRFAFRHPLVRHAVYQSAGGGWRIGAHARAAAALKAQRASAASRAHHVERSARPGDEAAVAVLIEAGNETAGRCSAIAARWYEAALRVMPEGPEGRSRRLEVLEALASVLATAGRLEASRAAFRSALDLVPSDSSAVRVRLSTSCAGVEHLLGRRRDAHSRLRRALAELPDPVSPEAAYLQMELSLAALYASDFATMRAHAREALDVTAALGSLPLQASAAAMLALAESQDPQPDSSAQALSRAADLVDRLTDEELAARIDAAHSLGWAEVHMERFDDADRHLRRGLGIARATEQGRLTVQMILGRAVVLSRLGRLEEAARFAECAVDVARLSGIAQSLVAPLSVECSVATLRGELRAAFRSGEESIAVARTLEDSSISARAGCVVAMARLEAGLSDRCRAELLEAAGGPDLPFLASGLKWFAYEALTRADIALEQLDSAEEWASRAEAVTSPLLPLSQAIAQRARAAVLLASGAPGRAAEVALGAAATEDRLGARIDACRSRILAGRALAAAGKKKESIAQLERAAAELSECGALRLRDEAARELRRLGRRVARPARPRGGPGTLSKRELEVAELVTQGKTNREIAAELFLSERTIESHLSRVFAKLGVTSRAAVGSMLARSSRSETQ